MRAKDPERKEILRKEYRTAQNEITDLTRKGKKEYFNKYFIENKANMHKIWTGINEIINAKSKTFNSPSNIKSSCLLYTSPSPRDRSLSRMPSSA